MSPSCGPVSVLITTIRFAASSVPNVTPSHPSAPCDALPSPHYPARGATRSESKPVALQRPSFPANDRHSQPVLCYNRAMKTLVETNQYLRDENRRRRMIAENVFDSSVFEGASGLRKGRLWEGHQGLSDPRRRIAFKKKSADGR